MSYRNQPPALNLYPTNVAMGNYREQSPDSSDEIKPPASGLHPHSGSNNGLHPRPHTSSKGNLQCPETSATTQRASKFVPWTRNYCTTELSYPSMNLSSAEKTDCATATDLAKQILPFIKGDLQEGVGQMPEYVSADWEALKKDLLNRFGQALPLVKQTKQDLKNLVALTAATKGIKTLEHFTIFRTKFKTITHYLVSDLESFVTQELIRDNCMKVSKDGGNILPDTQTLIKYIHQEVQAVSVLAQRKVYQSDERTPLNVKQQALVMQQARAPAPNPVDDLAKTLSLWNVQQPPGFVLASHVPYRLAQYEKPPAGMKCHYCLGNCHTPYRCNLFQQDEFDKKVYQDRQDYKIPNGTAVHLDQSCPVKAVVDRYAVAAAGPPATSGIIYLPAGTQVRKEEPAPEVRTSHRKLEECESEKLASYDTDMAKRLRNGKETVEAPKGKKKCCNIEEDMDVDDDILAIANNDYEQFPGYKELLEEIAAPKKATAKDYPEAEERLVQRMVGKGKMELSYDKIFAILKGVTEAFEKEISRKKVPIEDKSEKTASTGGLESDKESEEEETDESQKRLHYTCPLGYITIGINNKEVRALLDNGSMVNVLLKELAVRLGLIVTKRSMNLKGIGGHKNEILGIAEGVRVRIGNTKRSVHFWISSGDVQPILGKPFLIDVSASMKYVEAGGGTLSINDNKGGNLPCPYYHGGRPASQLTRLGRLM
ncbi:hypothetical protein PSHT_05568 [Puccinia striiformis]|uniref:Peptidase A2 domain-containing protein n=1 Tax=Puccinia striiformis TaxID=27350 RepID=A0A2S4WAN7_9BASI|nr:hypothetical protein PSHT_05568 [Puccinia striiformis]